LVAIIFLEKKAIGLYLVPFRLSQYGWLRIAEMAYPEAFVSTRMGSSGWKCIRIMFNRNAALSVQKDSSASDSRMIGMDSSFLYLCLPLTDLVCFSVSLLSRDAIQKNPLMNHL
jgi:hypothetical protein